MGEISQEKIRGASCISKSCYSSRAAIWNSGFEFNFEAAANYFADTGIIWEPSVPHAQQQIRLVERLIRTIVEGARSRIVDSGLPLKL